MSAAGSQVSYEDLYARWERGNWRASEVDFTEDRRQWREVLTEHERRAALWNYAMFFVGEDAVADDLAPFIAAAPLEEQKYFLATQQVDDLHVAEPAVRDAVADLIRRVTPYSLAVFIPPGWDRSYTEVFGLTLEEIYTEAARSFEAKLRSAGLPLESLPGPSVFPLEMSAAERATYGLAMLRAGFIGPPNGAPPRDPAAMELLFASVARAVDHRTAPAGPFTVQWEFPDAEPWHLRVDDGATAAGAGRAPEIDLELRVRYEDWVDVVAGRLDPRRALATGRLRPHGSPRALWAARGLF